MKASRIFVVVIIALMAVILLFEMNAPTRYQWHDISQSHKSKQPFGCYVMDSVLRGSLPQGYEVLGNGIEKYISKKYKRDKHTFLFTNNYDDFINSFDVNLLKLIEEGNNVVIASDDNLYYDDAKYVSEELGFYFQPIGDIYTAHFNKETLSDRSRYDTIRWWADGRFDTATYLVSTAFCDNEVRMSGSFRTLATLTKAKHKGKYALEAPTGTIAGIRYYGKGKVVMMSMPMLFSNYGILNDTIRPFVLRLLSECDNKPVVRYDPSHIDWDVDYVEDEQDSDSPLRYLLANRPLRWALYLALATLVAFVVFSARRRQRVIPVIKPPVNHMMDFVKRIGGIYYKRHDNVDLLIKKYVTFSNDLRAKAMIDIDNFDNLDDELMSLSNRTGIPFNELHQQIRDVMNSTNEDSISDEKLKRLIDVMNDIMHRINI